MDAPEPQADEAVADDPSPSGRPPGRPWTIAGFALAVIAFFFAPVYAGALGVFCGVMGLRTGDPLGKKAIIASIACMVAAIVFLVVTGR